MPSHAGMREAWDHLRRAQVRVASGDSDAYAIARDAAAGLDALQLHRSS